MIPPCSPCIRPKELDRVAGRVPDQGLLAAAAQYGACPDVGGNV
ncbi:hypothetical protein F4561_003969 [Lipingzhangella halophila]|uniref:Uncharacterized protein n=1 Tax=Lipingzhangella halophila TaxID=1783352 RepID=A0A7W7W4T6_9ACTN|nr:hypothetical protein [Lipingzhangella halophila]